jgi:putative intracellular protease/amidase
MLAQIVLYDGFDPLDVLLPYEVLSAGGILSGRKAEAELVQLRDRARYAADSSRSSYRPQLTWTRPVPT